MIPFNKPYLTGKELAYIEQAHANGHLAGDGQFSADCAAWLEDRIGSDKALLTHSCTGALEMAAILSDVGPGDEVIMPSYTFVSTANAFVLRGATPVFVDIDADTLNIDETKIEAAITPKTRVIVPVHYAGVGCDMDAIMAIAARHDLLVIEDAAQGLMSTYAGARSAASVTWRRCRSTRPRTSSPAKAAPCSSTMPRFVERAEIICEKGTNRSQFFRGQVDKYTWVDLGSSYLPGEVIAAFLLGAARAGGRHHRSTPRDVVHVSRGLRGPRGGRPGAAADRSRRTGSTTAISTTCSCRTSTARTAFIARLKSRNVQAVFHYVPLHDSPFGRSAGRAVGAMTHTDSLSERLVRLPLWLGLEDEIERVIAEVIEAAG